MTPYKNFALLYDELMEDAPYEEWVRFTEEIIGDRDIQKLVDLGCGTGELTLRFHAPNRELIGVDLSANMLAIAEQKSAQQQANVVWVKQDIRSLEGFDKVDLFISYCDVLNYVVCRSDLLTVFKHVYEGLNTDGLFIFDVHSMHHVTNNLMDESFSYKDESIAYIWDCFSGEEAGEMYHEMTFFYKDKEQDIYHRIDESHHQRTYDVASYTQLLQEAKFQQINVYGDFSTKNEFCEEKSERIFIVAKK